MKALKIIRRIALALAALIAALFIVWALHYTHHSNPDDVIDYDTTNPFIVNDTLCVAHRSGAGIAPEETLAAFKYCLEDAAFDVDVFEFDLHLTADDQLVLLHDDDLDRTSDSATVFGEEGVTARSKTLPELKLLNMGAQFVDVDGNMPYTELSGEEVPDDLRIATLDEALDYLQSKGDFSYIIEIKDTGEDGKRAADLLSENLKERGLTDSAFVCSFDDETLQYVSSEYGELLRGAGTNETIDFFVAALTNRQDYEPSFDSLQIPYADIKESYGLNGGIVTMVNYAHKHNLAIFYWTVNETDQMAYLASIDADGIITDYPNLFAEALGR